MFSVSARPHRGRTLVLFALLSMLAASGCGDSSGVGRTFPVVGKVTLNEVPLKAKNAIVLFKPDAERGNSSPFEPSSTVEEDGTYTLTTKGKKGAPPGWYKVIVIARDDAPPQHPKNLKKNRPVAKSLLPPKYGEAKTSDLSIEVVERPAPGAYDLKLTQ